SGAVNYDPVVMPADELLASKIVWLDAFITNVDRTYRNTNMLIWNRELWLIDHGAAFLFHHSWTGWQKAAESPFAMVKDHVLLPFAAKMEEADTYMKEHITPAAIAEIVAGLPD